ncbi:MAG: DUF6496 domain-containing protein [Geminicoccaceae bacterium]
MARVMHEFKHGELRVRRRSGLKVKNPKQAIAIALHEAGATNQESPKKNRENLRRTRAKERHGDTAQVEVERGHSKVGAPTKAQLMAEAVRRGLAGRSIMSKVELERAPHR